MDRPCLFGIDQFCLAFMWFSSASLSLKRTFSWVGSGLSGKTFLKFGPPRAHLYYYLRALSHDLVHLSLYLSTRINMGCETSWDNDFWLVFRWMTGKNVLQDACYGLGTCIGRRYWQNAKSTFTTPSIVVHPLPRWIYPFFPPNAHTWTVELQYFCILEFFVAKAHLWSVRSVFHCCWGLKVILNTVLLYSESWPLTEIEASSGREIFDVSKRERGLVNMLHKSYWLNLDDEIVVKHNRIM